MVYIKILFRMRKIIRTSEPPLNPTKMEEVMGTSPLVQVQLAQANKQDYAYVQNNLWYFQVKTNSWVFHMYQRASLMSLEAVGRGEIMAPKNPLKERDTWKCKHDVVAYERAQFHEKLYELQKEANRLSFLQKDAEIHGTSSDLAIEVTNLKASLDEKEKSLKESFS